MSPMLTLGLSACLGVAVIALSSRLKLPSIALLLVSGALVGKAGFGVIDPESLGSGLRLVVAGAVAVILFEGGLTLELEGLRRSPRVIGRLLTVGVLISWMGTATIVHVIFDLDLGMSLLAGSLVIVTGPTVVSPLLRKVSVRHRLRDILYWEAVVIDAVGVLIAALCFEWLLLEDTAWDPVMRFALRVAIGAGVGIAAGALVSIVLRAGLVPEEQVNIFVLTVAISAYAICDHILHEAGILAAILAGLTVAATKPEGLRKVKRFKLELTELSIGLVFILLAARLDPRAFGELGWPLIGAVAGLVFVLRPLAVVLSTWGCGFTTREKLFLCWIAPRGVVAASMASLFALELAPVNPYGAVFIEVFTYAVIVTTVIFQGLSAPLVARWLGVTVTRRDVLVVGEEPLAPAIAAALSDAEVRALALVPDVASARSEHHDDAPEVVYGAPLDRNLIEDRRFAEVGMVVAVSHNPFFNQLVCSRWAEAVGATNCYRWSPRVLTEDDTRTGIEIWNDTELRELSASIAAQKVTVDRLGSGAGPGIVPLFEIEDGIASVLTRPSDRRDDTVLIGVRPRLAGVADLVRNAVVISDAETTFESVVRQLMVEATGDRDDLDTDELSANMVESERALPTAIGRGVAIPHCYADVAQSICAVAAIRPGIEMTSPDGVPITLVFMVVSPVDQAEEHLRSLALLARLGADDVLRDSLVGAESSDQLLEIIHRRG